MTERIHITNSDLGINETSKIHITAEDIGFEDPLKVSLRRDGGIVISAAGLLPPRKSAPEVADESLDVTVTNTSHSIDLNTLFSQDPAVRHQFFIQQQQRVSDAFPTGIKTSRNMTTHMSQEHELDERLQTTSMSTCVIACTRNSLDAFGILDPYRDTEAAMIKEIGGEQAFNLSGSLPVMETIDKLLNARGVEAIPSMNFAEMLQNLVEGGVSIVAYGEHVRMISGAETLQDDSDISLTIHDPLAHVASYVSLNRMMEIIEKTGSLYQIVNVIAPSPSKDIEVTLR